MGKLPIFFGKLGSSLNKLLTHSTSGDGGFVNFLWIRSDGNQIMRIGVIVTQAGPSMTYIFCHCL